MNTIIFSNISKNDIHLDKKTPKWQNNVPEYVDRPLKSRKFSSQDTYSGQDVY